MALRRQGSGFLGVPLAFAEAGIATGVAGMIMFTVISNYTKNFLLSTMARAEAIEAVRRLVLAPARACRMATNQTDAHSLPSGLPMETAEADSTRLDGATQVPRYAAKV